MNCKKSLYRFIILCVATLALAACSGGDDSSPPAPGPQTWFFPESAALTASQVNSFDTQGLYFNVHSAANPNGEIRSQIVPSATFTSDTGSSPFTSNNFSTLLSGDQEVPTNTSKATGYGTVVLDPVAKTLSGVLVTSGVVGIAAHIHDGLPGVSGPVAIPLSGGPTIWTVPAGTVLTDAQVARLTAGAYYFNVHSAAAPNGEIRGQLAQQVRFAALSGANEVPPVTTTTASGTGVLAFSPTTGQISGFVKTSGITGTQAHIHEAATGVNGPVIVPLTQTPAGSGIWVVAANQTLTQAQIASFNAGNLYFNVHSVANPGGEIRGQILPANIKIGTAALDGSKEVPAVVTAASGTGIMSLNTITRQVTGNISNTGIAGTLAHVHEAVAGVNGPVIIPLTLTPPLSTLQSPLTVSTTSLADGSVGTAYSQTLTATGGTAPYTWAVASGALPAGLNLSAAGVISGTPTAAGIASLTVRVTDSATPAATATQALTLNVTAAPVATVSFATLIQPIFTANCTANCHSPSGIAPFLNLVAGSSYNNLLLGSSGASPTVIAGSSATSRLYGRVSGTALGSQMPLFLPPVSAADQTLIKNWIDQGAPNN